MMVTNEAIFRRWIEEVWNQGKEATIEELFDEKGTAVCPINPPERPVYGVEGFKHFFRQTKQLFDDISLIVMDIVAEGEKVIASCQFAAKAKKVNADGAVQIIQVCIKGLCQIKIRNGKIYYAWNNFDLVNALKQ